MAVTVKLPTQLRDAAGGAGRGERRRRDGRRGARGLYAEHGELRERIADDDGGLRRFVNVYLARRGHPLPRRARHRGPRRRRGDDPAGGRRRLGSRRGSRRRGAKSSAPTRSSSSAVARLNGERAHALGHGLLVGADDLVAAGASGARSSSSASAFVKLALHPGLTLRAAQVDQHFVGRAWARALRLQEPGAASRARGERCHERHRRRRPGRKRVAPRPRV